VNDNTWLLKERQKLPLDIKISITLKTIQEYYNHFKGKVYVSVSGKDSTALLHLVRSIYPEVEAVFVDTGLEYPEIKQHIKTIENVIWLRPKMRFDEVIKKYGYPVVSKEQAKYIREVQGGTTIYTENKRRGKVVGRNGRPVGAVSKKWQYLMDQHDILVSEKCCDVLKKRPLHKYQKQTGKMPIVGTMVVNSRLRLQSWMRYGCNAFDNKFPQSRPLSFWTDSDVWEYIRRHNIPYSKIYDMGEKNTGCMFCMFGVHLEKGENRFQRMKRTHPKQWDYCINKLGCGKVLDLIGVDYTDAAPLFSGTE